MNAGIPFRRITRILWTIVILLSVLGISTQLVAKIWLPEESQGLLLKPIIRLFDLRGEGNIPAWFSSMDLALAALILLFIGRRCALRGLETSRHWFMLSTVFLFLSLDEAASIHEMGTTIMHRFFILPPILYYAWVIPGALFVLVFAFMNLRFLFGLPAKTRVQLIAAGTIFVLGAVGFEMAGSYFDFYLGSESVVSVCLATVEEFFEMAGIVMFISALFQYIEGHVPTPRHFPGRKYVSMRPGKSRDRDMTEHREPRATHN